MSRPNEFRLRWKGAITGPFPLVRVSEMLRAGDISLLHNIEVDGSWMTVRDYFRAIGLSRIPSASSPDASGLGVDTPPPPPGSELPLGSSLTPDAARNAAGESLERTVREGYLWCGSTFLLPPLFALLIYVVYILDSDRQISRTMLLILLAFTTTPAALLPILFVRKLGLTLEQEGLSDIRQTQGNLVIVLGFLSLALWMLCFFVLLPGRP
jgi:hypothetical protein